MIKQALTISSTGSSRPSCRFEKGVAFLAGVTGMGRCSGGEAGDVWAVNPRRTCASNGTGAHPICPTGNSLKHFKRKLRDHFSISNISQLFVFTNMCNRPLKLKVCWQWHKQNYFTSDITKVHIRITSMLEQLYQSITFAFLFVQYWQ